MSYTALHRLLKRAVSDLTRAIELDSKYAPSFSNRGAAYAKLKNYGNAIADYNQAIALDPRFAPAFSNRGIVYDDPRTLAMLSQITPKL